MPNEATRAGSGEAADAPTLYRPSEAAGTMRPRAYWSELGFWPLSETGIYLLGMAQRGSGESRKDRETLAGPVPGLASGRVC